jgi:hypothetical protein
VLLLLLVAAPEPAPRPLKQLPLRIASQLTHVSAARELVDGRVIITDARRPAVWLLDPATGTLTTLGAAGGGPDRYAKPGGLYAGPDGSTLLLDRGQTRVFTISPGGALRASRSIARRGVTGSSDRDLDLQRVDTRGFAYFVDIHADESGPGVQRYAPLVRFDAEAQKAGRESGKDRRPAACTGRRHSPRASPRQRALADRRLAVLGHKSHYPDAGRKADRGGVGGLTLSVTARADPAETGWVAHRTPGGTTP